MSRRTLPAAILTPGRAALALSFGVALAGIAASATAAEPNFPITPEQRATAKRAAESGVPLSEIKPDAPDVYTVKNRDTLWGISSLYLKSPWRWPELWSMFMPQSSGQRQGLFRYRLEMPQRVSRFLTV